MTKQELLNATQEFYPKLLEEIEEFIDVSGIKDSTWVGTKEMFLVTRNGGQYRLHLDKQQQQQVEHKVQKMQKAQQVKQYQKVRKVPKNLLDRRS